MKEINILHIHGIGGDKSKSHNEIIDNLRDELSKGYVFNVAPVQYLKTINDNQKENWGTMYQGKDKKYLRIFKLVRKKLLNAFGDAAHVYYDRSSYATTMEAIDENLKWLDSLNSGRNKTIVITQSLGCQLFSSYMYDQGAIYQPHQIKISHWFSTGNNMRIFFHGSFSRKLRPFIKPRIDFQWVNFWNWGDFLGYPMKNINDEYNNLLTRDVHIRGGFPVLSHTTYNKNKKVIKTIASYIRKI